MSKAGLVASAILGLLLGGLVGFLLRPSVPVLGQLPFETVITRGTNLTGIDVILRPTAEQSFNYLIVGAVVGALLLGILANVAGRQKLNVGKVAAAAATDSASSTSTITNPGAFCIKCGKALSQEEIFCGSCGNRRQ